MRREDYDRFTRHLVDRAEADPRIDGLIALGSMADQERAPDDWSDHDFFVIAHPGAGDELRNDRTWLPDSDRIVVHFRETEHGRSAIYDDGHLAEFAVFEPGELELAKINTFRVLVGDDDLETRTAALATATRAASDAVDPTGDERFGSFCSQLVIGLNRHARGERLSANHLVRGWAVRTLLSVIDSVVEPEGPDVVDDLDPHRRFETAHPTIAAEIDAALTEPVPQLAAVLIDLAERELVGNVPSASSAAVASLRRLVDRVGFGSWER